ncbi:hypothetical protein ACIQVU_08035 [Lysinibacillus sp. NPDC098008]|uniref:hypothetical protein n=1 Tax=Lysinibacillus sp. NPDC098008 TaxID=3364146 RepID=UPI00381F2990
MTFVQERSKKNIFEKEVFDLIYQVVNNCNLDLEIVTGAVSDSDKDNEVEITEEEHWEAKTKSDLLIKANFKVLGMKESLWAPISLKYAGNYETKVANRFKKAITYQNVLNGNPNDFLVADTHQLKLAINEGSLGLTLFKDYFDNKVYIYSNTRLIASIASECFIDSEGGILNFKKFKMGDIFHSKINKEEGEFKRKNIIRKVSTACSTTKLALEAVIKEIEKKVEKEKKRIIALRSDPRFAEYENLIRDYTSRNPVVACRTFERISSTNLSICTNVYFESNLPEMLLKKEQVDEIIIKDNLLTKEYFDMFVAGFDIRQIISYAINYKSIESYNKHIELRKKLYMKADGQIQDRIAVVSPSCKKCPNAPWRPTIWTKFIFGYKIFLR